MNRFLRNFAGAVVRASPGPVSYFLRSAAERFAFSRTAVIHDLPPAFHYWSNSYLRPRFESLGFSSPDDFFIRQVSARVAAAPRCRILALGAGRCESEVALARHLAVAGNSACEITCIDLNAGLLKDGERNARQAGVADMLRFVAADAARLQPLGRFDIVIANQCLHHFLELEAVLDSVVKVLNDDGLFLTSDVIGRNGHQLWPEALDQMQCIWGGLPGRLRRDNRSGKVLDAFDNFNYADVGFEGIRAQDILALLVERFHFELFAPYACIIIPFVERRFGWNYDVKQADDIDIIDRIAQHDERLLGTGELKPTQLIAALTKQPAGKPISLVSQSPRDCIRDPHGRSAS